MKMRANVPMNLCTNYLETAPCDIQWQIHQHEFDEMVATKRNPLLALMEFRTASTDVQGDWDQGFLKAYQHVLAGGLFPAQFAAGKTVIIPKSSDADNNGFIVRSTDALRPLILCNCDCKILTTAICRDLIGTP